MIVYGQILCICLHANEGRVQNKGFRHCIIWGYQIVENPIPFSHIAPKFSENTLSTDLKFIMIYSCAPDHSLNYM